MWDTTADVGLLAAEDLATAIALPATEDIATAIALPSTEDFATVVALPATEVFATAIALPATEAFASAAIAVITTTIGTKYSTRRRTCAAGPGIWKRCITGYFPPPLPPELPLALGPRRPLRPGSPPGR